MNECIAGMNQYMRDNTYDMYDFDSMQDGKKQVALLKQLFPRSASAIQIPCRSDLHKYTFDHVPVSAAAKGGFGFYLRDFSTKQPSADLIDPPARELWSFRLANTTYQGRRVRTKGTHT